jgi:hypothetical protein
MEQIILKWENEGGSIRKWQISKNKEIVKNQALAACVINKKVQTLYSTTDGRVEKILVQDGEEFKPGYGRKFTSIVLFSILANRWCRSSSVRIRAKSLACAFCANWTCEI